MPKAQVFPCRRVIVISLPRFFKQTRRRHPACDARREAGGISFRATINGGGVKNPPPAGKKPGPPGGRGAEFLKGGRGSGKRISSSPYRHLKKWPSMVMLKSPPPRVVQSTLDFTPISSVPLVIVTVRLKAVWVVPIEL